MKITTEIKPVTTTVDLDLIPIGSVVKGPFSAGHLYIYGGECYGKHWLMRLEGIYGDPVCKILWDSPNSKYEIVGKLSVKIEDKNSC